jgi:hypothetical protein
MGNRCADTWVTGLGGLVEWEKRVVMVLGLVCGGVEVDQSEGD